MNNILNVTPTVLTNATANSKVKSISCKKKFSQTLISQEIPAGLLDIGLHNIGPV